MLLVKKIETIATVAKKLTLQATVLKETLVR